MTRSTILYNLPARMREEAVLAASRRKMTPETYIFKVIARALAAERRKVAARVS